MPTFIYDVNINSTPEKVFAHITEFANHDSWYEYPWRVESLSVGEIKLGSQFRSTGDDFIGKQIPNEIIVTEFQPPIRFCFRCTDLRFPNPTMHEFTLRSQPGSIVLERKFISNPGFPFNILFSLVIEPFFGRPAMLRSMNKIKTNIEAKL